MKELAKFERDEPTSAEVRLQLKQTRARVAASVDALRGDVRESVSKVTHGASELGREFKLGVKAVEASRDWARRHPWALVAGGLALGILLGSRRR